MLIFGMGIKDDDLESFDDMTVVVSFVEIGPGLAEDDAPERRGGVPVAQS